MAVTHIDHVNVRTANLETMKEWYQRVLNMTPGARPAFTFDGAWMYLGDRPVVHLVSVEKTLAPEPGLQIEHFAMTHPWGREKPRLPRFHCTDRCLRRR